MDEDFWREVIRARKMTESQRLREGFDLYDRSLKLMTAGIRADFPEADEQEVARIRRERLAIVRRIESQPQVDLLP
jgi:isocitrate dehydrogenase kinase/phosphatase